MDNTVFIDIYDIVDNRLYILANCQVNVNVYVNDIKLDASFVDFPQRNPLSSFEFYVKLSPANEYKLEFRSDDNQLLDISFSRPCNFSNEVGYAKSRDFLSVAEDNLIFIKKSSGFSWIKQEVKSLIRMVKKHESGFKVGIPFRLAYFIAYPFLRNRRIWFFMDLPEIADDNAKYLFKYVMDNNLESDVEKYFVLSKDSKQYGEVKSIGPVLNYKSLKHRFLAMFAEKIITSHPDNSIIYPFWGTYPHFAGLLKSSTVFLQHGIIKDDISSWLNKYSMNLTMFLTSSIPEYESIFKYPYHYNKNVVKLLGLPRYDSLKNQKDEKQIIIMPSWRRDLNDENISTSKFFKHYNSLINNEKLIEKARENNYKIIFRPHNNVYPFINMFDENDYVEIDYTQSGFQKLFNQSSLMITDYSSVAFDFAYLKKPVIYYHYADDYHFDLKKTFFNYENMGLGEISKSEEELVDLIIEYMGNNCKVKSKYLERIDGFFKYTDQNNCKRVMEAICNIPLK